MKVSSNRGYIKAKAVVTKRIRTLQVHGGSRHHRHPDPLGLRRGGEEGFIANTLTPFVGDANTQTPEFKAFWSMWKGVTETNYGHAISRHHS